MMRSQYLLWFMWWLSVSCNGIEPAKIRSLISQGKCNARCLNEFGTISNNKDPTVCPKLDCISDNCKRCSSPCDVDSTKLHPYSNCVKYYCLENDITCQKSCEIRSSQVSQVSSSTNLNVSKPFPICVEFPSRKPLLANIVLKWELERCSTTSVMYLVFMKVQQFHLVSDQWILLGKIDNQVIDVNSIKADLVNSIQFKVQVIDSNGLIENGFSISDWIDLKNLYNDQALESPTSLRVIDQNVEDSSVSATVTWHPSKDLSCFYEVFWMSDHLGNYKNSRILVKDWHNVFVMEGLEFSKNYTVMLYSTNKLFTRTSNQKAKIQFTTVDCFTASSFDYSSCGPEKPSNVSIEFFMVTNSSQLAANVSWGPPAHLFLHDANTIDGYIVEFRKSNVNLHSLLFSGRHEGSFTVEPDTQSVIIPDVQSDQSYEVTIRTFRGTRRSVEVSVSKRSPSVGSETWFDLIGDPPANVNRSRKGIFESKFVQANDSKLLIAMTLSIGTAVLASAAFIAWFVHRHKRRIAKRRDAANPKPGLSALFTTSTLMHGSVLYPETLVPNEPDHWETDWSRISVFSTELGRGAFGRVMKGQIKLPLTPRPSTTLVSECRDVALKILKPKHSSDDRTALLTEIAVLKRVQQACSQGHINILRIEAAVTKHPFPCLAVELCRLGNLLDFIRGQPTNSLARLQVPMPEDQIYISSADANFFNFDSFWLTTKPSSCCFQDSCLAHPEDLVCKGGSKGNQCQTPTSPLLNGDPDPALIRTLLSFAWQISNGMDHLAKYNFVHRDLALRNVLLCEGHVIKISDFGLTRELENSPCVAGSNGTEIESLYYRKNIPRPGEGAGKLPIRWMAPESAAQLVFSVKSDVWSFGVTTWELFSLGSTPYARIDNSDITSFIESGSRLARPPNCPAYLYHNILAQTWQHNPEDRPSFPMIQTQLTKLLLTLNNCQPLNDLKFSKVL